MKEETIQRILLAISWLSLKGLKVNKTRVANYTGLNIETVRKCFDDVLPDMFLISDAKRFDECYKVTPLDKRTKLYKGGYYE